MKILEHIAQIHKKIQESKKARMIRTCILVFCVSGLLFLLLHGHVETVQQHDERLRGDAEKRQEILAELEETDEETKTEKHTETTEIPQESQEIVSTEISETQTGEPSASQTESEIEQQTTQNTESEKSNIDQIETEVSQAGGNAAQTVSQIVSQTERKNQETKKQESVSTTESTMTQAATQKETKKEYVAVNIKIVCEKVIGNPDLNTSAVLPENGVFLDTKTVVKQGETVAQALFHACDDAGISYVNKGTSMGVYISAIGGLEEKQCGKYSGWKYKVNGVVPNLACSAYTLSDGDTVEWYYVSNYMD